MDTQHDLTLTYLPISGGRIKALEELSGRVTAEINEAYRERDDAECWRFIRKFLDLQVNSDTLQITLNEPALAEALEPFATRLTQELPETEPPTLELLIHGGIMKEWGYTLDSFTHEPEVENAASNEEHHTGV